MKKMMCIALAAVCGLSACAPKHQVGIVAHRGYWNCPEGGMSHNSIASLKAACEHGFWGTEFDVNMTSDGELLVYHDGEIEGRRINFTPKAEFDHFRLPNGEHIPTLDEYLSVAQNYPKTKLVLELKWHDAALEQQAVDAVVASLKAHGLFTPERVMFISFSLSECRRMAEAAPGFTVQYLSDDCDDFDTLAANGVNGIDLYFPSFLADSKWKDGALSHGFGINVWTVNGEDDIRRCLEAGIDFITTDNPELARTVLSKTDGMKEFKY